MLEYGFIRKQVDEVGLIHMVSKMYVIFSLQEAIVSDRAPSPAAEPLILSWSKSLPNKLYKFFRETYLNRTSKNTWLQIVKALFLWHICPFRLYHKFAFYLAGRGWELPHVNCVVGCHLYSFALAV